MVLWLEGMGAIRDERWTDAFEAVPREAFLSPADVGASTDEERLRTVYRPRTYVTRRDANGVPCSSGTTPIVVAMMLEWLGVEDGHRVLEIGTGTGYSTALLCARLGAENVTTIDNQADLSQLARDRLGAAGHHPTVLVGDGASGAPEGAPYDRVIGTCYAWPIPMAWIRQTRSGGRVVAVLPSGSVGLDVRDDGGASGHLHPRLVGFMYMRPHMPEVLTDAEVESLVSGPAERRPLRHPPQIMLAGGSEQQSFAALALAVSAPYLRRGEYERLGRGGPMVDLGDLSWVRFDGATVVQGGPRRLWDEIETLYGEWCRLGAPNRERFGLTVTPDGRHELWLDDPDSQHRWPLTQHIRRPPGPRAG
jgi:protein-L-isoaspartate O-methyltransferase